MSGSEPGGPASFCGHCGGSVLDGDPDAHASCDARLALEPPRYCPRCRRRMRVQVIPREWTATCVEHGTLSGG